MTLNFVPVCLRCHECTLGGDIGCATLDLDSSAPSEYSFIEADIPESKHTFATEPLCAVCFIPISRGCFLRLQWKAFHQGQKPSNKQG